NRRVDFHNHPEFEPEPEVAKPKLKPMLRMSNREFKEKFGHVAGSWRGKKPLQRNALLALAHYRDKTAVPEIIAVMKHDPRPDRNRRVDFHNHPEFEPEPEVAKPKLKPMLRMSNREFKEKFGHVAGSWRGKKPLQRNALLALAHYRDKTAVPEIIAVMKNDPRPMIRGTAAWSLGKIGTEEAFQAIREAMQHETDERVLLEMEKGLAFEETY